MHDRSYINIEGDSMELRELDLRDLDRRALAATGEIVGKVGAHQLGLPTPCTEWTLGELLRHLVSENQGFAVNARGVPDRSVWDGGRLGEDPHAAYLESAELVTAAFADDDVFGRDVEVREFGVFSAEIALSLHFVDFLVHGWDVAKAIGAPIEFEEELAVTALAIAHRWPDDRPNAAFDIEVEVTAAASPTQQLVAFLGRPPSWPTV
ncbi:TIGR03086 family metal-binding protein [Catenulispora yoronensis]|uniref:TIGR03086 family metal-binding protein n=1 Tax=Catenulispora yoronensis TaxID=450799 RepID=A0ABN2U752_9ACTN